MQRPLPSCLASLSCAFALFGLTQVIFEAVCKYHVAFYPENNVGGIDKSSRARELGSPANPPAKGACKGATCDVTQ